MRGRTEWDDDAPWEQPTDKPTPDAAPPADAAPADAPAAQSHSDGPDTADTGGAGGGFNWDAVSSPNAAQAAPDKDATPPAAAKQTARDHDTAADPADVFVQPTPPDGPPPPTPMPLKRSAPPPSYDDADNDTDSNDAAPVNPSLPPPAIYQPDYDTGAARPVQRTDWSAPENAPLPAPQQMPETAYDPERYGGYVPEVKLPKREIEGFVVCPWTLAETIGWLVCSWLVLFAMFWFAWLVQAAMLLLFDARELPLGMVLFINTCVFALLAPMSAGLSMMRGYTASEYLNLKWPTWKQTAVGVASIGLIFLAATLLVPDDATQASDRVMRKVLQWDGVLPFTLFAVLVLAPVWEEIFFRGFIYKGIEVSALKWPGATIITAAAWALVHIDQHAVGMALIFIIGLALGAIRAWTGSTLLTIGLHVLWNTMVAAAFLFFGA